MRITAESSVKRLIQPVVLDRRKKSFVAEFLEKTREIVKVLSTFLYITDVSVKRPESLVIEMVQFRDEILLTEDEKDMLTRRTRMKIWFWLLNTICSQSLMKEKKTLTILPSSWYPCKKATGYVQRTVWSWSLIKRRFQFYQFSLDCLTFYQENNYNVRFDGTKIK